MKNLQSEFQDGQILEVVYKEDKRNGKPAVGFYGNIICFTSMNFRSVFPQAKEIWYVKVETIKDKFLIVMPISKLNSLSSIAKIYERPKKKKLDKQDFQYESKNGKINKEVRK